MYQFAAGAEVLYHSMAPPVSLRAVLGTWLEFLFESDVSIISKIGGSTFVGRKDWTGAGGDSSLGCEDTFDTEIPSVLRMFNKNRKRVKEVPQVAKDQDIR